MHEKDFKLKTQWPFFATSHKKRTECDSIGSTVKQLGRKQSLQHMGRQITSMDEH